MNGQFMTGRQGFFQIAFHYKTNHHLTINTSSIRYEDGQNHLEFLWDQEPTQHHTEGYILLKLEVFYCICVCYLLSVK